MGVVVLSPSTSEPKPTRSPSWTSGSRGRAYLLKERVSDIEPAGGRPSARWRGGGSVIDPAVVDALVAARSRAVGLAAAGG
jgi:hypothetical protein